MAKKPNFFIIGAPKCGTTSLAEWLAQHPQVFVSPIKEPFFFSSDIENRLIQTWDNYNALFENVMPKHVAVGEASTTYLFSHVAVPAIEKQFPDSRYVAMLRNPSEMAYALHEQYTRAYYEDIDDFQKAWALSPERRNGRHVPRGCSDSALLDYQSWCRLGEQVERLFRLVPRERIAIVVLDDIKIDPRREYLKVLDFLGVPDDGRIQFPVYNPAREWRSVGLGKALRAFGYWVFLSKHVYHFLPKKRTGLAQLLESLMTRQRPRPAIPPDFSKKLNAYYLDDIRLLENLIGRSFASWYNRAPKSDENEGGHETSGVDS